MNKETERRLKDVFNQKGLDKQLSEIDKEIERLVSVKEELKLESKARIEQIQAWENSGNVKILGHMGRDGKEKYLMFILRYPDYTQRTLHWSSNRIAELRKILVQLKEKYPFDWGEFTEELC